MVKLITQCFKNYNATLFMVDQKKTHYHFLCRKTNLTMPIGMRRFTRLTNAFSKKIENHFYAIALHFVYYNFARQHKTIRVTPAIAAGITKRFMSLEDVVGLVPDDEPNKRGSYKKKGE